jgi:hypothetical protein
MDLPSLGLPLICTRLLAVVLVLLSCKAQFVVSVWVICYVYMYPSLS